MYTWYGCQKNNKEPYITKPESMSVLYSCTKTKRVDLFTRTCVTV